MVDRTMGIVVGSKVVVRPGGAAERNRWAKRELIGTVVDAQDIQGYGYGVMIQWPDEERPWAFEQASHYQLAST